MWPWKLQLAVRWQPYVTSWSKRSLTKCGLLDNNLCKTRIVRHFFEWVWVILGGWVSVEFYFGWVNGSKGMDRTLFWVGGGGWGWLHCLIMPHCNLHLANKLMDPTTSSKTYWSILKTFYVGRKIPIIPLLLINGKLETDFKKKDHPLIKKLTDINRCLTDPANQCLTDINWYYNLILYISSLSHPWPIISQY